jgi:hypothetical protein
MTTRLTARGARGENFLDRGTLRSPEYNELLELIVATTSLEHKKHWIEAFCELMSWSAMERRNLLRQLQADRHLSNDESFELSATVAVAPPGVANPPTWVRLSEMQRQVATVTVVGAPLLARPRAPAPERMERADVGGGVAVIGALAEPTAEVPSVVGRVVGQASVTVHGESVRGMRSPERQRLTANHLSGCWYSQPGPGVACLYGCCGVCLCVAGCCMGCPYVGCCTQRGGPHWRELFMDICSGGLEMGTGGPRAKLEIISRSRLACYGGCITAGFISEQYAKCCELRRL